MQLKRKHQIRMIGGEQIQRFRTGVGSERLIVLFVEDFFQHVPDMDIVVNDCDGSRKKLLDIN